MKKKAMVTGASRGIGEAIAYMLAAEGYDLLLVCKQSEEKLKELKRTLEKQYPVNCIAVQCDVSDAERVEQVFIENGDIDVLVNNAAISYIGLLTDMTVEQWHKIMGTNLNSVFYTCKQAVPGMVRKRSGKIINISSVWGNTGASMEVAYSTAKGGLNSFTRALAKELAPSNVQVNAIAFGVIDTQMNHCFSEEERKALTDEIPADRMGTPREAALMVRQILNAPDYLTGQIITMDGGFT